MKLTVESPFIQKGIKISNLLILNMYILIGCIPVFTIGASLIAGSSVCLALSEDREDPYITRAFWKAWVQNLPHGILISLIMMGLGYVIWMNFQLFNKLPNNPIGFLIMAILAILIAGVHLLYAFALSARYDNGLLMTLINSRKICVRFYLKTLTLLGILAVQCLIFFGTAPFLNYVGIFVAPALIIYTICKTSMPIFRSLDKDSKASDGFSAGAAVSMHY